MVDPAANAFEDLDLAPADYFDPVIEAYKKDVDRTLLRENLKLTMLQRVRKAQSFIDSVARLRGAAARQPSPPGTEPAQ